MFNTSVYSAWELFWNIDFQLCYVLYININMKVAPRNASVKVTVVLTTTPTPKLNSVE